MTCPGRSCQLRISALALAVWRADLKSGKETGFTESGVLRRRDQKYIRFHEAKKRQAEQ